MFGKLLLLLKRKHWWPWTARRRGQVIFLEAWTGEAKYVEAFTTETAYLEVPG